MRFIFNKEKLITKTRDYFYKKNEEQLQREKITLKYDYMRSLAE